MSSGAGTNTVTSQSGPPSQFVNALGQLGQQAQQTAQTPYQPYTGQLVAPMNGEQNTGIANINYAKDVGAPYLTAAGNEAAASTTPLLPGVQPYLDSAGGYYNAAGGANLPGTAQPGIGAAQSLYGMSANNAAAYSGYIQPGINQANSLYGQSAQQLNPTQFSAGQVAQYQSPYTQQVVDATQAQFNNQNAQQRQAVAGNAISQGAFGGDREAVAQGITAGQQQLAQAPVIAGLMNQGYSQALGEFNNQQQIGLGAQQATQQLQQGAGAGILAGNNQILNAQTAATQGLQNAAAGNLSASQLGLSAAGQNAQLQMAAGQGIAGLGQTALGANQANAWLNSQAAQTYAGLGNQAYNQWMGTGNAQIGAGSLQQQQQQAELNVPYQQFIQQQAYPFQIQSWLSGLEGQLANAAGGTASTTSPGPSPISQIGGLGITGLAGYGLLNNAGLLGAAGGGGGAGLAAGDAIGGGAAGFVGDVAAVAGAGAPLGFAKGGGIVAFPAHKARPGRGITANDNRHPTPPLRRVAGGGLPGIGADPIVPRTPMMGRGIGGQGGGITAPMGGMGGHSHHGGGMDREIGMPDANGMPSLAGSDPKINGFAGTMARGGGIMRRDIGGSIDDQDMPVPPIPPENVPPQQSGGIMGSGEDMPAQGAEVPKSKVPWETLLAAGLSIMGGASPHASVNIGRGGMQGLEFGEQQRVREENAALRRLQAQDLAAYRQAQVANAANKTDIYGQRVDVLGQEANNHATAIQNTAAYRDRVVALRAQGLDEKTANNQALNQIRQQNADTALYGAFTRGQQGETRLAQGQARVDQGDQRIQQAADRLAVSREAQQARLALTSRGQDTTSANADINAAARMVASGMVPDFPTALQKVQAGRATQGRQPAAATPANPATADPLGIR